jgi:hypothetical protein
MAFSINHKISIVSVFNGKEVSKKTITCQTPDKIRLSFLKFVAKVPLIEVTQIA